MYQNYLADHVGVDFPYSTPAYANNAARHLRLVNAVGFPRSGLACVVSGTGVASQFSSLAVGVSDAERRGRMVLSYKLSLLHLGTPAFCTVAVADVQSVGPLSIGTVVPFAAAADVRWSVLANTGAACNAEGRLLVDTRIDSATPGVDTRTFLFGAWMTVSAATMEFAGSIDCRLVSSEDTFFQPSK